MKKRNFILYYLLSIALMFLLAYFYEFWIEDHLPFFSFHGESSSLRSETIAEHWEFVLTITIFSSLALLFPFLVSYRQCLKSSKIQSQLDETLTKLVGGFVGICCVCKKVRVEDNPNQGEKWEDIDRYIKRRTDLEFIYGCCPECASEAKRALKD